MKYQEHKQLIQVNVIPQLSGKLFISNYAICLSSTDTMKLFYSLKQELPDNNYFLYKELNSDYINQAHENFVVKNYNFDFSLMPYARKHGLVKQLKKMINE